METTVHAVTSGVVLETRATLGNADNFRRGFTLAKTHTDTCF